MQTWIMHPLRLLQCVAGNTQAHSQVYKRGGLVSGYKSKLKLTPPTICMNLLLTREATELSTFRNYHEIILNSSIQTRWVRWMVGGEGADPFNPHWLQACAL